jgi:flagellar motor switch protein FliM
MTISELSALRVGEVVEIPRSAVDQVQLVVAQQDGKRTTVAAGRLGSYESAKVVKLDSFVDPRLREHLRQLWPRTVPAPEVAEDGPVSEASAPE